MEIFPVFFPVGREFRVENDSQQTPSAASESFSHRFRTFLP